MAKVMTANYRHVVQEEGKDYATRYVLQPGDDPSKLPREVRKELEERGMIKDEEQYDAATGVVLPPAEALKRYQLSRATPVGETGADADALSEDTPKGQQARRVLDPEAAAERDKEQAAKAKGESTGDTEEGTGDSEENAQAAQQAGPKQATPPNSGTEGKNPPQQQSK